MGEFLFFTGVLRTKRTNTKGETVKYENENKNINQYMKLEVDTKIKKSIDNPIKSKSSK